MRNNDTLTYIIGSGNIAKHFIKAFSDAQINIGGIWSRNLRAANELSKAFNIPVLKENHLFNLNGIFVLAVADAAIEIVATKINPQAIVIHTSGSTPLNILTQKHENAGVFYPLQTFSKNRCIPFNNIPFLIEYSNDQVKNILENWATKLQTQHFYCSSSDRMKYHLAAVFACNFPNHMIAMAEEWIQLNQLDFELLKPLIVETFTKILEQGAFSSQTGPAIRNDQITIEKHLKALDNHIDLKKMYSFVTESIINFHAKKLKSNEF
ncbi:MAG: Rossmann-like and DUF2520 domain-containing protein [Bacteroidales bacterium]